MPPDSATLRRRLLVPHAPDDAAAAPRDDAAPPPGLLCSAAELPPWSREGFIKAGFRRPGPDPGAGPSHAWDHGSVGKCVRSVWAYWHTETVNIHTHLWGAATVLLLVLLHACGATHHLLHSGLGVDMGPDADAARLAAAAAAMSQTDVRMPLRLLLRAPSPTRDMPPRPPLLSDKLAFTSFYLGAILCLGFSATYHTLNAHSHRVARLSNRLDYIGIVCMIVGSYLPALHYGFHCHPYLEALYGGAVTLLGAVAIYLVAQERYTTPAYRTLRTNIFLALGLSAIFPTAHLMSMYGVATVSHTMGMYHIMLSGALYVIGALTYLARFPERLWPGRFDYIGASHQLFHVAILLAAAAHWVALRRGYTFWHTVQVGLLGDAAKALDLPIKDGDQATVHAVCQTLERWRRM